MRKRTDQRILAVEPWIPGFGFAVLEGRERLLDWGVRGYKDRKLDAVVDRLGELIEFYGPDVLVLPDLHDGEVRRGLRAHMFLRHAAKLAEELGIRVSPVSQHELRRAFGQLGCPTKHKIATKIGEVFPELAARVPRYRKVWMNRDDRMPIFDSVALGLSFFARSRRRPVAGSPDSETAPPLAA